MRKYILIFCVMGLVFNYPALEYGVLYFSDTEPLGADIQK